MSILCVQRGGDCFICSNIDESPQLSHSAPESQVVLSRLPSYRGSDFKGAQEEPDRASSRVTSASIGCRCESNPKFMS